MTENLIPNAPNFHGCPAFQRETFGTGRTVADLPIALIVEVDVSIQSIVEEGL
jgi:hypothetical protein